MKYYLIALALLFLLTACDNELNLTAEKEETSVVFGLLNPSDTAQYIRVERAFIDPNVSALDIAQIPDSIYYQDLDIKLVKLSEDISYDLEEVDGNVEGYIKDDGAFAQSPNTLYKIKTDDLGWFDEEDYEDEIYELRIKTNENDTAITSQTLIAEKPSLTRPKTGSSLAFSAISDPLIRWLEKESLKIYDVRIKMYIKQQDLTTGEGFVDTTLIWDVAKNVRDKEVVIPYQNFFLFLRSELKEDPDIRRRFIDMDVELYGGGEEMDNFVNVLQANLGITSSQEIPIYTNMSDGLGIFSSRNEDISTEVRISPVTIDSLYNGSITKDLNFQ